MRLLDMMGSQFNGSPQFAAYLEEGKGKRNG